MAPKRIDVKVGDFKFSTSHLTLTREPDSLLAKLVDPSWMAAPDGKHKVGEIFIDRDGQYFEMILNYLRNGISIMAAIDDSALLRSLLAEAEYYQLAGLGEYLYDRLNPWLKTAPYQPGDVVKWANARVIDKYFWGVSLALERFRGHDFPNESTLFATVCGRVEEGTDSKKRYFQRCYGCGLSDEPYEVGTRIMCDGLLDGYLGSLEMRNDVDLDDAAPVGTSEKGKLSYSEVKARMATMELVVREPVPSKVPDSEHHCVIVSWLTAPDVETDFCLHVPAGVLEQINE